MAAPPQRRAFDVDHDEIDPGSKLRSPLRFLVRL
jgi:hypothetical protein